MAEVGDWYQSIPKVTRYWFTASVALPLLGRFNVFSPYSVILTWRFITKFELWRPLTAVLYYPLEGKGFHYLMNLYFLYSYSKRLEEGFFSGRQADYIFMLLFNWIALVGVGMAFGLMLLMDPMVLSVLYVYCMINQDQIVSFWFGTRFKARYLPWALLGVNFLIAGGGLTDLVGIIVGHLYYFVMMKYPAEQGITLLRTPQFLYSLFPAEPARVYVATERRQRETAATGANAPTGYNWGQGRRLED